MASGASRGSPSYGRRSSDQSGAMPKASRREYLAPDDSISENAATGGPLSPPLTPIKSHDSAASLTTDVTPELVVYDFSKIDYELEQAKVLGKGLWSTVYLADGKLTAPRRISAAPLTPPASPDTKEMKLSVSSVFAVKMPARPEAVHVFRQEAVILSHLSRQSSAAQYIVPFLGLDMRPGCSSLVFEAVIGGSLENLNGRLQQVSKL
jgi:hypothetical protein